ncbi:MAG TPA: serine hydrolase domain-containing protein [Thermoanaerobaculia bacterium]|nr:serine hydrolase domain-containing protein [Thermoanaerobaculia bacterium]
MMVRLAILLTLAMTGVAAADDGLGIDDYVRRKMRDHLIPGTAVVVIRDGAVVHRNGFGELAPDSPIIIGSLSKAFTATALLQLVDAGRVRLDAPVVTYLPDFAMADPDARKITVRQLLNQNSGIPSSAARAASNDASLAEHVAALRDVPLETRPGERHIYSSPNYQVLGRLVEVVSGQPFGSYVESHIFRPLQMSRSAADAGRVAPVPGHNIWWGVSGPTAYRWEPGRLPTASLIASADDMGKFALAQLGAGTARPLLSAESLAEAHRGAAKSEGFSYAMGWRDGTTAGVPSLWHGGALPSYRGAVVLLPQSRSAVIVFANSSSLFADHTREIAAGIVGLLHGKPVRNVFRPLRYTYLAIAIGAALLVMLQVRTLVRALRGTERKRHATAKVVLLDIVLPLAVLLMVPRFVRVSWRGIFESAPDLAVTAAVTVALTIVTAVVRLRRGRAGVEPLLSS